MNDPGTAIAILGTGVRVLDRWCGECARPGKELNLRHPSMHVPTLSADDLFEDLFASIARDGAGMIEVGVRLQKSLVMLAEAGDDEVKRAAQRMSAIALEYGEKALAQEPDRGRLADLATRVGAGRGRAA